MARKKHMSLKDANAYKVQQEGKAALVTAWMPLLTRLVTVVGVITLAWMGVDAGHLKPIAELFSVVTKLF